MPTQTSNKTQAQQAAIALLVQAAKEVVEERQAGLGNSPALMKLQKCVRAYSDLQSNGRSR